jgi:hypothetical protein
MIFFIKCCWILTKDFLHLMRWWCDFVFDFVYVLYYMYWLLYVEQSFITGIRTTGLYAMIF